MLEIFRPFIISLVIGFIIGIERERSHPVGIHALGVRTFILFALAGTLAAKIDNIFLTAGLSIFVFTAILLGYIRATGKKRLGVGITTELAAGIVFCLGYLTWKEPLLALLLSAFVLLVLVERKRLHIFAREQLKKKEIQAAVFILLIGLGVLAFLPNHTIDPWGIINPRRLGIVLVVLCLIQFSAYVAIRIFGDHLGILLMGFFGGLVSSTAIFATLPGFYKEHRHMLYSIMAAAILSVIAMLIEFSLIVFAAAPTLLPAIFLPIVVMIAVGLLSLFFVFRKQSNADFLKEQTNPLDFISVIRLFLFIGAMLLVASFAQRYLGNRGLQLVNFIGGLFEIHSISLATATLYAQQKISLLASVQSLALGIFATYVSKFILLFSLARNRFGLITALFLLAMLLAGGFAFYIFSI